MSEIMFFDISYLYSLVLCHTVLVLYVAILSTISPIMMVQGIEQRQNAQYHKYSAYIKFLH